MSAAGSTRETSDLPRRSLALLVALHALPLAAAAVVLPWRAGSWLSVALGVLVALHLAVFACCCLKRDRELRIALVVLGAYSLSLLSGVSVLVFSAGWYLSELYRGIGTAITAALFCLWAVLVLFTVPVAVWGLVLSAPVWRRIRVRLMAAGASSVVASLIVSFLALGSSVAESVPALAASDVQHAVKAARSASGEQPGDRATLSLSHVRPAPCAAPIDERHFTTFVTAAGADGVPFTACLQAQTRSASVARLEALLRDRVPRHSPVAVDVVTGAQKIHPSHPLLDALKIRPALDGVCGAGRCLVPFQLVALDAFTQYRPLPAVPDASFGCSLAELSRVLGGDAAPAGLVRIETGSYVLEGSALLAVPLRRLRPIEVPVNIENVATAVELASDFIARAQLADGAFRYALDPFTGKSDTDAVNLPRQAGTVLALCELAPGGRNRDVARRGLQKLASFEREFGERSALSDSARRASLGQIALPLVAFATCRGRTGKRYDALVARLASTLLRMQRADGSFFPELSAQGTPRGEHASLYGGGQAVLALLLLEGLAAGRDSAKFPEAAVLRDAAERAMTYYAGYWPAPLRDLFYLEENWHCLAAREALARHRHDAYERFCLDYVGFKSRLILSSGAAPEHVGGYSLSDMLPPHSTPTAGFGEALAAAIAVGRARGLDTSAHEVTLRSVLGFLLRHQWTAVSCFACADGDALGGFSESSASPSIRIDYVQHAMAAIGHGGGVLGG